MRGYVCTGPKRSRSLDISLFIVFADYNPTTAGQKRSTESPLHARVFHYTYDSVFVLKDFFVFTIKFK